MSNEIEEILDKIQYKTKLTLEQIADRIGYSRPHLNAMKKKGDNPKLIKILHSEFKEAFDEGYKIEEKQTIKKEDFKEKYLSLLEKHIHLLTVQVDEQEKQRKEIMSRLTEIGRDLLTVFLMNEACRKTTLQKLAKDEREYKELEQTVNRLFVEAALEQKKKGSLI